MGGGTHSGNGTVLLEIPAGIFHELEKESKRKRKSVQQVIGQILEDRADFLQAEKRMADIRSGKEKLVPAEDVYKRLGLA